MSEIKLPPSLCVVVDSEVLGQTAVSVPAKEALGTATGADGDTLVLYVSRAEIEDEIDRRETAYLDSHTEAAPPEFFTVPSEPFRDHMEAALASGVENWDTIADRVGWWRTAKDRPDGRRPDGQKVRYYVMDTELIPAEVARELADAMNMEPHEAGL